MELAIGLPPDGLVGAGREHFDEQQEIEWKRQELLYVYGAGLIIIPRGLPVTQQTPVRDGSPWPII